MKTLDSISGTVGKFGYESLGYGHYLVGNGKHWEIKSVTQDKNKKESLDIDGTDHDIIGYNSKLPYRVPKIKDIELFCEGKYKVRHMKLIFDDIVSDLKFYLHLKNEEDYYLIALFIIQTYCVDFQDTAFYLNPEGSLNSAKTIVLERIKDFGNKCVLVKDISGAGLTRTVNKFRLNILVDELDQISREKKSEIESMLRAGYRRGNPAIKLKPKTFEPEVFETFGAHAYTNRGSVEDALDSRSLSIQMIRSQDDTLPLVNAEGSSLSYPLQTELFFWKVTKYLTAVNRKKIKVTQVTQVPDRKMDVNERRRKFVDDKTEHYSDEEKDYRKTLFGRNQELYAVMKQISGITEHDIQPYVEKIFERKKEESDNDDSLYSDALRIFLLELHGRLQTSYVENKYKITKGKFNGCYKYPAPQFRLEFQQDLRTKGIHSIGSSKVTAHLRDLGFVRGDNLDVNQKIDDLATKCIVFSKEVKKKLGL